jgi:hypothetical protein
MWSRLTANYHFDGKKVDNDGDNGANICLVSGNTETCVTSKLGAVMDNGCRENGNW